MRAANDGGHIQERADVTPGVSGSAGEPGKAERKQKQTHQTSIKVSIKTGGVVLRDFDTHGVLIYAISIFKMGKLLTLHLYGNRLVTLPEAVSSDCPLQSLDLHSNQLTSLPQDLLRKCTKYVSSSVLAIYLIVHLI